MPHFGNSLFNDPYDIFRAQQKNEKPRKLDTPLAAMLPSKYANVEVTELFPDFRPDKVSNITSYTYSVYNYDL